MYTDPDTGYTLRYVESLYVDFGLEITDSDGKTLYYNPCCLSRDSYGVHWTDEEGNDLDEGIPWTDEEWAERLESEAWELIEAYIEE